VRRALATTVVAGLVLLGCTGTEDDNVLDLQATQEPDAEETEEPEPEETEPEEVDEEEEPEPEDPYAVPDEIDEDYVERVINAILQVQSEVLRGVLQQQQGENLDPDLVGLHFATTDGNERQMRLDNLQRYIDEPERQGNFLPADEIGVHSFRIEQLVHAEPSACIIAVGYWDNSEVVIEPRPEEDFTAFSLSRVPDDAETSEGNPTPWYWRDNAQMAEHGEYIPRERWSDLDYDAALDHTCEDLP
jgi:hypothetical protein